MATSGENYWPPTGRTSWPLTLPFPQFRTQQSSACGIFVRSARTCKLSVLLGAESNRGVENREKFAA